MVWFTRALLLMGGGCVLSISPCQLLHPVGYPFDCPNIVCLIGFPNINQTPKQNYPSHLEKISRYPKGNVPEVFLNSYPCTSGSQTFLARPKSEFAERLATHASNNIWWKIIVVWMIFSSRLLSSFLMSTIYSLLKYLRYRQKKTSNGNGENIQPRFRSTRRAPFFHPLRTMFGSWPILWEPLPYTNLAYNVMSASLIIWWPGL